MNPYFLIFEFGALFSFLLVLYHERRDRRLCEILGLAFAYGLILETLNIYMSGVYAYSPAFLLKFCDVPLSIGAGWAVIYYLAQSTANRFDLRWWQSPLLMALLALSCDVAMDAVAIRLGFWSWKIPLDQEWFGVPYDNFFGWLAVVWTFTLCINLSYQDFVKSRYRRIIRYSSPVVSSLLLGMEIMVFVNLSAVLSGRFTWGEAMDLYLKKEYAYAYLPAVQSAKGYLLLALVLAAAAACSVWIRRRRQNIKISTDTMPLLMSVMFHLLFLFFLLVSGIYKTHPIFILISLLTLSSALVLEIFPRRI